MAMSRALMRWSGSGKPLALRKWLLFNPQLARLLVHQVGELLLEPAIASANTTQASLPESTITTAGIRSSTFTCEPIWNEPSRAARAPGPLGETQFLVELQPARLQQAVDDVHRHQLGHGRRRHRRVGVLFSSVAPVLKSTITAHLATVSTGPIGVLAGLPVGAGALRRAGGEAAAAPAPGGPGRAGRRQRRACEGGTHTAGSGR